MSEATPNRQFTLLDRYWRAANYVSVVKTGNLLFTAGQIPLVPETMEMVTGSIEAQTERVIQNLSAILKDASTSWDRVLKTTVFLADMGDFAAFNTVYEKALGGAKPARSAVQVPWPAASSASRFGADTAVRAASS